MAFKKSGISTKTEPTYEVIEKCGVISTRGEWKLELRYMSWNGKEPKYDLRTWKETEEGESCNKGITMSGEELESLMDLLNHIASET